MKPLSNYVIVINQDFAKTKELLMIAVLLVAAGVSGMLEAFAGYRYYREDPMGRSSWNGLGLLFAVITVACLYAASLQAEAQDIPTMYFGAFFVLILLVEVFASWRGYKRRVKLESSTA